ncbi:MAG: hypothetical protein ISS15_13680 [Alphaproteobacteria bacterium]|nr:hypothetical protein [Alphaproteobacteria bacterium]MBL6936245.1 hypothetical protein [Alphaproteobacteria bacterium]MBL7098704.1 hypothetical protein [Alphaproteobacteria bacterium]
MFNDFAMVGTVFWIVVGAVLIANGFFVYQVRIARYRVMQTLAEKGQPVPVELFNGAVRRAHSGLMRAAIILMCLGIAFSTFFWSMTSVSIFHGPIESALWLPTLGLFPIMLGLAFLLMAFLERTRPQ